MRQPPTAFQKMHHRRAQIAEQQKRQELARLAHHVPRSSGASMRPSVPRQPPPDQAAMNEATERFDFSTFLVPMEVGTVDGFRVFPSRARPAADGRFPIKPHVSSEAACASPENFNAEIGRRIARESAVGKIWPLMGYELRSKLAAGA